MSMFKRKLPDLEFDSEVTLERYEYIFDTVTEANSFVLPKDEDVISFSYWPEDNKVHLMVKSPKIQPRSNFISKIRQITQESKHLEFAQKYPWLANEIENAARCGHTSCWVKVDSSQTLIKDDLIQEGFKILNEGDYVTLVSWDE